ncbi:uncharacterized protein LOC113763093 isoform X2 [Coffea eugenioides]|uniref:uncharacterized protein LOC113763093 isoform X2 n=1 Tax=Coffea eugenioides TaxID=49369 RepID=UPI000F60FDFB|nr:uncharacterized protein LOC113763093 isoform X2 [Coffea eugenioides]
MRIAVKRVIYFESTQLDGTIMVVKFLDRRHLCLAPDNVECTTYISCNILGKKPMLAVKLMPQLDMHERKGRFQETNF